MDKFFYEDADGQLCLDMYSIMSSFEHRQRQNVLRDINKSITLNIRGNFSREKELKKLIYFAKYHNRKVGRDGMNFPELSIDIREFE